MVKKPSRILPVIIFSQFAGTSLWFASNAILGDLQGQWGLGTASLSHMTSAVQFGFIVGTLLFAFFTVADRYSPRKVYFACSWLGALANLGLYLLADGLASLLIFRFMTGFFLAGIYPVGMKIAAGWYRQGLGLALGWLVGALVVGTAFPHLIKCLNRSLPWEIVIISVSIISAAGGCLIRLLVPDGPYLVKGTRFNPRALAVIFRSRDLRSASFGYFGHMWELYTVWAFIPLLLGHYVLASRQALNVSWWSFVAIAAGGLGCVAGGLVSKRFGSAAVAFFQLLSSGICCLLTPLMFHAPPGVFLSFLIFWGIVVVGDSPQFSALTAKTAPPELIGSALTIVTSIGFSITIISIQFTNYLVGWLSIQTVFFFLVSGPVVGLTFLWPLFKDLQKRHV
ncbi:MAG: MFS transporter [Deltaproteobacteria bacterium]|nr:MFS transporter [Deltaproteobacteria bacterium]